MSILFLPYPVPLLLINSKLTHVVALQIVSSPAQQDKAVQRRSQLLIGRAQLFQRSRDKLFRLAADTSSANGQAVLGVDALFALLLDLEHLLRALPNGHVSWRLVDQSAPGHVLQALLLDLDVDEDQCMQPNAAVFLYPVVKRRGLPCFGEEDHGDGLAEVVELEAAGSNARHDGGVGDGPHRDLQLAGSDDEIGMRSRSVVDVVS
ncbi:hypothetical protein CCMA1212_004310 [Trichoderma ghanense]|uniref:Uncharacterized protein n=1 Tax=Trichoderma ghanense TaxID=65468 RepID=A0ABY2H7D3_9HYPO